MLTRHLKIAVRFTLITTLLFGLVYPLGMTLYAHFVSRDKADGQLVSAAGQVTGSRIIGQSFTSDRYFHGRPSLAGNGYDATSSGGSNLGSSSRKLIDRVNTDAKTASVSQPGVPVPADLVEASGSGLDPDVSPASALYQVERVAHARGIATATLEQLVQSRIQPRQFGFLGEPRVNVLALNLALDQQTR